MVRNGKLAVRLMRPFRTAGCPARMVLSPILGGMAVGIPVPHLQFEEDRRQEEEDQSLDEAHQQLNRQKREYAQGAGGRVRTCEPWCQ